VLNVFERMDRKAACVEGEAGSRAGDGLRHANDNGMRQHPRGGPRVSRRDLRPAPSWQLFVPPFERAFLSRCTIAQLG